MSLKMLAHVSHKKSRTSNPNLSQEVFENSVLFDGNEDNSAKVRGAAQVGIKADSDDEPAMNRLLSLEDIESLRRDIEKRIKTPERLSTAYVRLDKNKDGLLSKKEFKVMIGILAKGSNDTRITSPRGIDEIWKAVWGDDSDKPLDASAQLTQEKFVQWIFPKDETAHEL